MTSITYTFHKNGHSYSTKGNNRFEAQTSIEVRFHINLTGATFEEIYKMKTIRTGIVK